MYEIPDGFLRNAIEMVRSAVLMDQNEKTSRSDRDYFLVAADVIWDRFMMWKNTDSPRGDRNDMTWKEVRYACIKAGIPTSEDRKWNILLIEMPNHTYYYQKDTDYPYGGLFSEHLPIKCSDGPRYNIKPRTLVRFLGWFDSHIDSIQDKVMEAVSDEKKNYRKAQLIMATVPFLLEPGLEDIDYSYSFTSNDDGDFVDLRLYGGEFSELYLEDINFHFTYEDLLANMELYKKIVRIVAEDHGKAVLYPAITKKVDACWMTGIRRGFRNTGITRYPRDIY